MDRVPEHTVFQVLPTGVCGTQLGVDGTILPHVSELLQRIQIQAEADLRGGDRKHGPIQHQKVSGVPELYHLGCVRYHFVLQDRVDFLQQYRLADQLPRLYGTTNAKGE